MAQKKNTTPAAAAMPQDTAQALQAAVEAAAAVPAETAPEAPAPEPGVKPADDAADKAAAAPAPSNPEASDASGKAPAGKPAAPSKGAPKGPRSAAKTPATVRESAAQRIAREVFRSYPDRKTVHVASDGTAFFNRSDAVNYGRTLKDTTVVEVTNQNLKA